MEAEDLSGCRPSLSVIRILERCFNIYTSSRDRDMRLLHLRRDGNGVVLLIVIAIKCSHRQSGHQAWASP